MRAYLFCVLFALLHSTHQTFLEIQITDDTFPTISRRILELDTETAFPIIEAVKIQLGEWSFWVTLLMFVGVVFMAWKENCLGKWERTGAYTVFGGLIFFTYWTIPFIIGLGVYCFRQRLFTIQNSNSMIRVNESGTEMKEHLLPNKIYDQIRESKLEENEKYANPPTSLLKKILNCFVSEVKNQGRQALNEAKNHGKEIVKQNIQKLNAKMASTVDVIGAQELNKGKAVQHPLGPFTHLNPRKPVDSREWDTAFQNHWPDYIIENDYWPKE